MSDLNDTLRDSYISKVAAAVEPYSAELIAADFDPTSRVTQLKGAGKEIEAAAKAAKAAHDVATTAIQNTQNIRQQRYTLAVGTVSLVEGALGKSHPLTVKLRGLRSHLIGNQNSDGGTSPTPPTPSG